MQLSIVIVNYKTPILTKNCIESIFKETKDVVFEVIVVDNNSCDESKEICLAGVFGGLNSGVSENTKNIFIESALFNAVSIRKTAKRHGLNTDASFRYERGVDSNMVIPALIKASQLILELSGGEVSSDIFDLYPTIQNDFSFEIDFNDIRTTLQALYAIYDNCNSLHTNAYDEAITTPTEDSVRRAMAIQLIINKELGLAKNENPLQGSYIIEELTSLVEEAVLIEFDRINERGGVLGSMETMYQRSKIQEESLHYETLKHTGEYPIIGVNTFLNSKGSPTIIPSEVIRANTEEKEYQISMLKDFKNFNTKFSQSALDDVKNAALNQENIFDVLMVATKTCSLGQITNALFDVGGQYRRNM